MVKLKKELRREVIIEGQAYTVRMASYGVMIAKKGFRKGYVYEWERLAEGPSIIHNPLREG